MTLGGARLLVMSIFYRLFGHYKTQTQMKQSFMGHYSDGRGIFEGTLPTGKVEKTLLPAPSNRSPNRRVGIGPDRFQLVTCWRCWYRTPGSLLKVW